MKVQMQLPWLKYASLSDCLGCQAMVMEKLKNDEAVFHLYHNHGYDDELCVLNARDENLRV